MRRITFLLVGLGIFHSAIAETQPPQVHQHYQSISKAFEHFDVILQPDTLEPEWWAGAPSVVRDSHGVFWMACRMRTADAPRGLRGYELRVLRSDDGIDFTGVRRIHRDDIPIKGFERPCLMIDPVTGLFKMYFCGPWENDAWTILKFDDFERFDDLDVASVKPVIGPIPKTYERDIIPQEYKDAFIFFADGLYHAYVIGVMRRTERIFHFSSTDGEEWTPFGNPYTPVMNLDGWHNFYVRPACVLPLGVGYLFVYEGSNSSWYDPVYNIGTGLGFTFDLHTIIDLTPDSPVVLSNTPNDTFYTFRYSHWLPVGDELWVYAEVATPEKYHEIRLYRIPNVLPQYPIQVQKDH